MKFIADFHIHSKYSRATSKEMVLENIDAFADDKGILVMGTGDFTHPQWFDEIKNKLEPAEPGLFKLKKEYKRETLKGTFSDTRFILTVEISSIYSKNEETRRVHNLVFAPNIETAEKINAQLGLIGNLKSDGRPILGLDSEKLAEIVFNVNPEAAIIPAHAWTPWFSVFGSMSGFDSLEECFGKYAKNIFAIETGLSSDPAMNRRLSKLDNIALISNSDSHSLPKIGREANIFDTELSYKGIMDAIKSGTLNRRPPQGLHGTIEFFPEEGKYHFDGHRDCGVYLSPEETKKHNGICPKCGRHLTIGVMNRVDELADRQSIKVEPRYYNLIPLGEIIAEAFGVGENTKQVKKEYEKLIKTFGNELKILMEISENDLKQAADPRVAEGIKRVREGKVKIRPGYDGEYGEIKIFNDDEREELKTQGSLF
ncbi:MAG: endonuclease Q family protein [Patescibacteria group bacterium]|nr:endonuclease Q family protein [Patescibacteria group bacterium]